MNRLEGNRIEEDWPERDWQDGFPCGSCGRPISPNEFIWFGGIGPPEYLLCGKCLSKAVQGVWQCIRCGAFVFSDEAPSPQGRDPLDFFCPRCRSLVSEGENFSNVWATKVKDWRCIICWQRLMHRGHWRKYAGEKRKRKIPPYYCERCYYQFIKDPKTGEIIKPPDLLPHIREWYRAENNRRQRRHRWKIRQRKKKAIDLGRSSGPPSKWPDLGPTPRYQRKREAVASIMFTPPSRYDELRDEEGLLPREEYEKRPELTYMDDIVAGIELEEVRKSLVPPDSDWMSWIENKAKEREIAQATGMSSSKVHREKKEFIKRMRGYIWDKSLGKK